MRRARRRDERGQATVELALFVPVLLVILYTVMQFGQVYLQYPGGERGDERGRTARIDDGRVAEPGRTSTIVATVRGGTTMGTSGHSTAMALAVSVASYWTPGSPVTVTSTYPASVSDPRVHPFSGTLTTKRTARVLN